VNRRLALTGVAAAALVTVAVVPAATAEQGGRQLQDLRTATTAYHDFDQAVADGFSVVTDLAGLTCIDTADAAATVHREAHGLVAQDIFEVKEGS